MLGTRPLSTFPLSTLDQQFESQTAIVTLRYSTHTFTTRGTDVPANTTIPGRINRGLTIARRLRPGPDGQLGSIIETSFGEIELANDDGALDVLSRDYFADGRPARVKIGAKEVVAATRILPRWIATESSVSSGDAGTPFTANYPASGVVAGDFFWAQITINDRGEAGQLSAVPAGWEVLAEDSSGALYQALLYRFSDGTENGGSVAFDWESSDGDNDCIVGAIHQMRYVDPDSPIEGLVALVTGDLSSIDLPSVTTTVPNGLAVAALSMSDNASLAGPSGEAGGSWAYFGPSNVATETGDDAANRRLSAAIGTPGTITGGSIAITPTDAPVSEVSLMRGFALRGLPAAGGRERVQAFSAFATVYRSVAGSWSHDHDALRLSISDLGSKLQDRLQLLTYSGAGDQNGTADLSGRSRPLGFGLCRNVTLQLVDPFNFVLQVSSEAIFGVDAVYDRGAELDFDQDYATFVLLQAAVVASGTYATCLAEGYVKVGGGADPGSITADVRFDGAATHSSVIRAMAVDFSSLVAADIDQASFDAFATAQPGQIGIFFPSGDQSTVEEAISQVAFSGGAAAGQDGSGLYRVVHLTTPAIVPHWAFDERTIVYEPGRAIRRRGDIAPWESWGLGYDKNWTLQRGADVAAGVSAERKIYLQSEHRFIYSQDAEIALAHATARSVIRRSLFLDAADAQVEADRLRQLYSLGRAVYEVPVKTALFSVRIGETVRLTYPRWGLNQGRNFLVIGVNDDADAAVTDLLVFG